MTRPMAAASSGALGGAGSGPLGQIPFGFGTTNPNSNFF
jgi:hypothetical protein